MKDDDDQTGAAAELSLLRQQVTAWQKSLEAEPAAGNLAPLQPTDWLKRLAETIGVAELAQEKESGQRRQAETALRESEKRYKQLLDSVTDYIYTVEIEAGHTIATVHSPNCVAVTGYTSQEYQADPHLWLRMVYEQDRAVVVEQAHRLLAGEAPPPLEHRLTHKDGSVRWVRHTSVLRKNEQGCVAGYDGLITDITARKQLEERLEAIYQLGSELTLLHNEEAIIGLALQTAANLLGVEAAGYGLVNELTADLDYADNLFDPPPHTLVEFDPAARSDDQSFPPGQTVEFHRPLAGSKRRNMGMAVIRTGQAIHVADITKDARYIPTVMDWLKRSVLATPMRVGQRIIGVLSAASVEPNHFSLYDQQLLQTLADQTAVALENARLFKAEQANREQAQLLREATAALTSLDPNQVLDSILTCLGQVVPYDEACIFLWEEEDLRAVAGRGNLVQEQVVGQRYPVDSNLLREQVEHTNHALMLVNTFLGLHNTDYVPGWMSVPLRLRGEVIGYLTLDRQRGIAYGRAEVVLAQAFANQAAAAIHNARLFEQVRAGREQLQFLSRRLVEVQETERRHIARELHDEAGQALTSMMVGLRLLERDADSPATVVARAAELKRMTDGVLENLHRLAMDLRPASLDHVGLVAALRQYIERFSRQHGPAIIAQFEAVGFDEGERLSPLMETTLYRIVQEALTNVVKHAQANHLDVLMKRRDERVIIVIEDDGVGFDFAASIQNHHLGLLGIRERTEMLGGCLVVESSPGTGTTIYVEVPVVYKDPDR